MQKLWNSATVNENIRKFVILREEIKTQKHGFSEFKIEDFSIKKRFVMLIMTFDCATVTPEDSYSDPIVELSVPRQK